MITRKRIPSPDHGGGLIHSQDGNFKPVNEFLDAYFDGRITCLEEWRKYRAYFMSRNDAAYTTFERNMGMELPEFNPANASRLVFPSYFLNKADLANSDRADWQHVDTRVKLFAASFIKALEKAGIPFYCHSAFRTRNQQNELYKLGRTKAVWPCAAHCQGKAVDLVHGIFHWELTAKEWQLIGRLGRDVLEKINRNRPASERFQMEWGGDWKFYDPAHWELVGWRDDLRALESAKPVRLRPALILKQSL